MPGFEGFVEQDQPVEIAFAGQLQINGRRHTVGHHLLYFFGTLFVLRQTFTDKIGRRRTFFDCYAFEKAEIVARKAAIRTEDIAKGVFIPVSSLPQREPQKGAKTA